jgi:hypothetical protein
MTWPSRNTLSIRPPGELVPRRPSPGDLPTYGYDPNGNRIHVNATEVARYDDQDRLLS